MRRWLALPLVAALLALIPASPASAAVMCHGHRATIVKGKGAQVIFGTRHRDIIVAGGGGDAIFGRRGDDLICSGRGSDVIDGGKGLDPVYAGPGTDACAAKKAREHLLHHGCELHITPPEPPGGGHPHVAARQTSTPAVPQAGAAYHDSGEPNCVMGTIGFGNVVAAGAYTDPAYVAVRPYLWEWRAGWAPRGYQSWQVFKLPGDGAAYNLNLGNVNVGGGYWYVGYEWLWWNGSAWVNEDFTYATSYAIEGISGNSFCVT